MGVGLSLVFYGAGIVSGVVLPQTRVLILDSREPHFTLMHHCPTTTKPLPARHWNPHEQAALAGYPLDPKTRNHPNS